MEPLTSGSTVCYSSCLFKGPLLISPLWSDWLAPRSCPSAGFQQIRIQTIVVRFCFFFSSFIWNGNFSGSSIQPKSDLGGQSEQSIEQPHLKAMERTAVCGHSQTIWRHHEGEVEVILQMERSEQVEGCLISREHFTYVQLKFWNFQQI